MWSYDLSGKTNNFKSADKNELFNAIALVIRLYIWDEPFEDEELEYPDINIYKNNILVETIQSKWLLDTEYESHKDNKSVLKIYENLQYYKKVLGLG